MVPGDNFLSLSSSLSVYLSLSFFFFNYQAWHSWLFLLSTQLTTKGPAFGSLVGQASGRKWQKAGFIYLSGFPCNLVNRVANGSPPWIPTHCAPQWGLIHISYNRVFKSFHALWRRLALCACSPEAFAPSSSFKQAYVPAPDCCSWTRKRQASFYSLFFCQWIDYRVWNGTELAPTPGQRMHRLAFWSSNISHWDTPGGGRARAPQVVHYEPNNLLSTKEK